MPGDIFERLGGVDGVAVIVRSMYDKVLRDEQLAPFFKDTDLDHLHRMQFELISTALEGPVHYSGADLTAIHAGRGITAAHFARFIGHLASAMEERGADKLDVDNMLGRMAMYRDRIIGVANVDG